MGNGKKKQSFISENVLNCGVQGLLYSQVIVVLWFHNQFISNILHANALHRADLEMYE